MQTLTIPQIFSRWSFYQYHYQSLIQQPECYTILVENAFITVFPFRKVQLYLGDLLQLWFSRHWQVQPTCQLFENLLQVTKNLQHTPVFVYQIQANLLTGSHCAEVWDQSACHKQSTQIDHALRYWITYRLLQKPANVQTIYA
ncbi:hypothetical protein F4V57_04165 [Acinetobacter qingfengensis]|uniref:Uncharacterized protein n=1 Tax=Acinetobacter qingfengensis TaxID=1262585 RepID=A0A1E7RCG8_9GAMM|nr:hypothetical protein [Acinetobacter qingfengensis]KAA8734961.1 hypothetical protein F4V57_04165 [Acinetobacter qingfengensis]OEY97048.1 hypothetical protein BJI46_10970 [Acinetobacter qingfengensis]